ncbi:glutamine-hydrolyzing carbamoyl-phosphate synthase small subunit [Alkaliphilus pronyensis]|uniref:Carbamoyl phosphate synthase small chain n=1 Tax=Alkaliphilus pronyensis TaxID=1482732 RepID=A0A6I0EYU3_9FIRM|nr:carbamoyl phosphate synthase small subunit [Alkaliphilus pronyensis]KAB3534120.1 glutamine-hydrolyzing carbamoyl-phosphate synthase small subunit [Alkaliphilus pronyensis]
MKAKLILENGTVFIGKAFGHIDETLGEVVFNTAMTGYQEVLTDPSYTGQIVTMTYPLIGNYGINLEDNESTAPKVKGLIVRERATKPSHWRCEMDIDGYLKHHRIMAIEGIDTRALTKIIRTQGTMKGIIITSEMKESEVQQRFNSFCNKEAVKRVTAKEIYNIEGNGKKIAVLDFGVKQNIIASLRRRNCNITVFPAYSKAKEILSINPDGILLSNGPGDPKDLPEIIYTVKELMKQKPIFGICLGHQLLSLALGGDTEKLKYGHRGCNHPVKDINNNRVYITSQNHGYVVKSHSLPEDVIISHINLNDNSIEGIQHVKLPLLSVQFHPEASPGPKENDYLFDRFLGMVKEEKVCQGITA